MGYPAQSGEGRAFFKVTLNATRGRTEVMMDWCPLSKLCTCSQAEICSFCKWAVAVCLIVASGLVGYLIGRKSKKGPSSPQ